MRKILIGFVLMLVFLPVCVSAETYYVDATNGDDSKDGQSEANAWKTISKVNSFSSSPGFNAGDAIKFKCGEEWREELNPMDLNGALGNQIIIQSYGSGAKPIINGADLCNGTWTNESGTLWYHTWSIDNYQTFFDGVRGNEETVKGNVDAEYDWYYDSGNSRLYVYSVDNPNTIYTSPGVEATARTNCISLSVDSYVDVTGLNLKYADFGVNVANRNVYTNVYGNDISYVSKRGVYIALSSDNCKVYQNNISYCGVEMPTQEHAIYNDGCDNTEIYENEISYSWNAGVKVDGGDSVKVYRNYLHHCNQEQTWSGNIHITQFTSDVSNVDVYYNLIEEAGGYAIEVIGGGAYTISNIDIYNNAIYDSAGGGKSYALRFENIISGTFNFKNNIIHTGNTYVMLYDNNVGSSINRDYNYYYGWTHGTYIGSIDGASVTWAEVNAVETNSINSDPLFTDATNNNFAIEGSSPCRDVGTNVSLTQDYEGNNIIGNPDIGAYEISGSWYFSSAGDDNDNSGYSTLKPLKTISRLNGLTFDPGDNIYFNKGDTWREQLTVPSSGSPGSPITFSSYGEGVKPKLLHSVARNDVGNWTDEGGNIWYAGGFGASNVKNVIMDSENSVATMVTNKVDLDAQGEAWWDEPNTRIYMYSVGNPATVYNNSLECAITLMNKINAKSWIVIDGLDHRYTGNDFWYIYDTSDYVTIQNCNFRFAGSDLSGLGQSYGRAIDCRCPNSTISDNDFYYAFGAIVIVPPASGALFTIENNTIQKMVGKEADADGIGVVGSGAAYDCSGSIIKGNDVSEFSDDGIDLYFGYNITVESNVVHDSTRNGDGNGIKGGGTYGNTGNQILRNLVYNINTGNKNGIVTNGGKNGVIAYNIVRDVGNRGIWVYGLGASGENDNWEIYNNVCYNCPGHAIVANGGIDPDNKITATIQNNILDSDETDMTIGAYATITGGYNCLLNDATANVHGTSTYSGTDLGSTDPLFVNASNNDFHLQFNSPCIDNGTDVGLTLDFEGNPVPQGSAPDIGAYEYVSGETLPADLDNDGDVDIFDLDIVAIHFGQTESHQDWDATADVVENNEIDVFDLVFVASRFT